MIKRKDITENFLFSQKELKDILVKYVAGESGIDTQNWDIHIDGRELTGSENPIDYVHFKKKTVLIS